MSQRDIAFEGGKKGTPIVPEKPEESLLWIKVKENHSAEAWRIDKPIAGLLRNLKQRGMLDDTLILFTTDFGRTPFAQSKANQVGSGRDHNK